MGSNYKLDYNVDLVFCIDCTESMDNILNIVKARALGLYNDIQENMQKKGKQISRLVLPLYLLRRIRRKNFGFFYRNSHSPILRKCNLKISQGHVRG